MSRPRVVFTGVSPAIATVTLVALAGAVLATEALVRGLEPPAIRDAEQLTWWSIGLSVLEHALILAATLLPALLLLRRLCASDFGLRRHPWSAGLISGAAVYVGYLLVAEVLFSLIGAPSERASAKALSETDSTGVVVAYVILACIVAPPTEELFFRGFLFGAFRRRLPAAPAAIAAGALFGASHGPPLGTMLDLALLGIALCVLYERTGSLLPCIGVHAVHNALVVGAVVSLSLAATLALAASAAVVTVVAADAVAGTPGPPPARRAPSPAG